MAALLCIDDTFANERRARPPLGWNIRPNLAKPLSAGGGGGVEPHSIQFNSKERHLVTGDSSATRMPLPKSSSGYKAVVPDDDDTIYDGGEVIPVAVATPVDKEVIERGEEDDDDDEAEDGDGATPYDPNKYPNKPRAPPKKRPLFKKMKRNRDGGAGAKDDCYKCCSYCICFCCVGAS